MKKSLVISIACILLCLLCACGNKKAEIETPIENDYDDFADTDYQPEPTEEPESLTYQWLDLIWSETYDENGHILKRTDYDRYEDKKETILYEYIFDSNNPDRVIEQSGFIDGKIKSSREMIYNEDGNVIIESHKTYHDDDVKLEKTEYTFFNGVKIEEKEYDTDSEGALYLSLRRTYDSQGKRISWEYYDRKEHFLKDKTVYDSDGHMLEDYRGDAQSLQLIEKNVYDVNGNLTEYYRTRDGELQLFYKYVYNSSGDCIERYSYNNGIPVLSEKSRYDANGRIIFSQFYNDEGVASSETQYTYEDDGSYKAVTTYEDCDDEEFEEYDTKNSTLLTYTICSNEDGQKIICEERKEAYNEEGKIIELSGFVKYDEEDITRSYECHNTWENGQRIKAEAHGYNEDDCVMGQWVSVNDFLYLLDYIDEDIFDNDLKVEDHEYIDKVDQDGCHEIIEETRTVYQYHPNGKIKSIKCYYDEDSISLKDKALSTILKERGITD